MCSRSSVWIECLPPKEKVAGSNPAESVWGFELRFKLRFRKARNLLILFATYPAESVWGFELRYKLLFNDFRIIYKSGFILLIMRSRAYFLIFLVVISSVGFVFGLDGSDTMTVSANILRSEFIGIEVPDTLYFGDVQTGEKSDTLNLYINNTGNIDITVTPELTNDTEEIFSYLFFQRVQSDTPVQIGSFSVDISKPSSGEKKSQRTYVTLDLREFDGELDDDITNHQANVIFWALPK